MRETEIAPSQTAAKAAKQATSEILIVMAPAGNPVGTGLIVSLARPGGNVSGSSSATAEIAGESLEIIRDLLPSARRVAVLANSPDAFTKPFLEQVQIAACALGLVIPSVHNVAFEGLSSVSTEPTGPAWTHWQW